MIITESDIQEVMLRSGYDYERARKYLIRQFKAEVRQDQNKDKIQVYRRNPDGLWATMGKGKTPDKCPEQVKIMQEMVNYYDQKRQGVCDIAKPECMVFNPFKTHSQIIMETEDYDN